LNEVGVMPRGRGAERRPSWVSYWRFVLAARHGWRAVLRALGPTFRRLRLRSAALDFGDGLSRCMQVVAKRVGGRSVQSTRGVSAERGAVENGRGRWPQAVAGAVARRHSLRRLPVAVIRRHSLRAAALPRRKKRSLRRLNLVSAKTGSIICWRCA